MRNELLNAILSGLCTQYGSTGLSTPEEIVSVAFQIQNEVYKQTGPKPVTNQNGETVELKLEW